MYTFRNKSTLLTCFCNLQTSRFDKQANFGPEIRPAGARELLKSTQFGFAVMAVSGGSANKGEHIKLRDLSFLFFKQLCAFSLFEPSAGR